MKYFRKVELLRKGVQSYGNLGALRNHGEVNGIEPCKTSFFLNPTDFSLGYNRTPSGDIWFSLQSKDVSNLQFKTELCAGL